MPFTFKLSKRVARMRDAMVLAACSAAVLAACELQQRTVTGASLPVALQIVTLPKSVTLAPYQTHHFMAYGRTASGDSISLVVRWSASGGIITSSGIYTAGSSAGTYRVIASAEALADTAAVTVSETTAPVASISVVPATATVVLTGTRQFTATLRDALGNLLGGRVVTWTSSAPLVAAVSPTGLVTGLLAGTATIRATSEGQSGTATITVTQAQPAGMFPNEPSGFAVIQETGWEGGTLGNWSRIFQSADKPVTIETVGDSPLGESKVLQIGFAAGHEGGGGTELRYNIPSTARPSELYVGFYIQVSADWQGHSSAINKMVYLSDGDANTFSATWYEMFGSGSNPLDLYVVNQSSTGFHENVNQIVFQRGRWHRVEIYQQQGGLIRVWVDGALAIDRLSGSTRTTPFDGVVLSGIWGGIGDTKDHWDYMRFDRVRISAP